MKKYELIERTNGSVSPAQMDTTEYPPEGQNVARNPKEQG